MSSWSDVMNVDGVYLSVSWHTQFPILAASTENRVDFFSEDGRKAEKSLKKDGSKSGLLSWHPSKKLLASSWSNGALAIWNDAEQSMREAIGHHAVITTLTWSPNGCRLVSGDADGEVVIWRCDVRGRLTSLCQYRMKSSITHCVFRNQKSTYDPRTNDSPLFFLAASNGSVYYADDVGRCSEDIKLTTPIVTMLMLESTDTLIIVNEDLLLSQYSFSDVKFVMQTEFKLSTANKADRKAIQIDWAGPGILSLCSGGKFIKMWDLNTDESFNLVNPDTDSSKLICFAYNPHKNVISASTDTGHFLMWKKRWVIDSTERTISWELCVRISIGLNITFLQWGSNGTVAISLTANGLTFFAEQVLGYKMYGSTTAVQIASNKVMLANPPNYKLIELGPTMRIKSISLSQRHLAVSNGITIDIFEHSGNFQSVEAIASIQMASTSVHLDTTSLIVGTPQKINICNYQGTIKQFIKLDDSEGELSHLDVTEGLLLLATSKFVIKTYDISRRDPKLLISRKFEDFLSISSIRLNNNGSFISMFAVMNDQSRPGVQTRMILYNLESDKITPVDFGGNNITPVTQNWDTTDSRILVCEVEGFSTKQSPDPESPTRTTPYREVFTMFATPEKGLMVQDRKLCTDSGEILIGICMPYHFYLRKTPPKDAKYTIEDSYIEKRPVRDFEGMKDADANTIKASIDFSFHLSMGNMDEAFKCIHAIKNKAVWEHMAKICVKTKRLDVAMICLSNIGSSNAIRALREASKEPEPDVQTAILATYLGLMSEAEELLTACGRFDILNRIYQANGQWDKALEMSGSKDRINLRTTFHKFGRYLGEIGDVSGSLAAFEKSAAYSFEIPRMLLMQQGELEKYIKTSEDKNLKKWWAQFCESQGDYNTALNFYEQSGDILSTVRVHCYSGNIEQAIEIANRTKNSSAAYHIARQYENEKKIKEAIEFYSSAKCFNHAIRLAKAYNMETELIHLALQGSKESMLEVARYYEGNPKNYDKAVHLFFKAGSVARAIDLCFQTNQFAILADLVDDISKDTDPKLLKKCAAYFYESEIYDKAVTLLIKAGEYTEAIDICMQKNVSITEEMANSMSNQECGEGSISKSIMLRIADCCLQQRSFLIASKKYTQAGDRLKAMKALLQSGDTEKIIIFANAMGSKQKEIFVMVANYLQTLDWRNVPNVMKAIISFYTKAKAMESLATFYESCGQVEIDEYQNYEKGLMALKESEKCLGKAKNLGEAEIRLRVLHHRMAIIAKFCEARVLMKADPHSPNWVEICEKLLEEHGIDDAVKSGDIYAMMIEKKFAIGSHQVASEILQRMKQKVSAANIEYYLDVKIVKAIDKDHQSHHHRSQTNESIEEKIASH